MVVILSHWQRNKTFFTLLILIPLLVISYSLEFVVYAAPVAAGAVDQPGAIVPGAAIYWVWDKNGSDSFFGYTKENTAYETNPGFSSHDIEGLDCANGVMYAVSGRGGKAPSSLYTVEIGTAVSTLTKIADIDRGGGQPAYEATALAHKWADHSLWVFIDWIGMRGIYHLAFDGKATLLKETTIEAEAMAWIDDTLWLASGSKVYSFQPGGAIVHRFSIPAAKIGGIEGMDAIDGKLYIGIHDQGIVAIDPITGVIAPEPGFPAGSDIEGITFCEDGFPPATPTSVPTDTPTNTPTNTPTYTATITPTTTPVSTVMITPTSTPTTALVVLPTPTITPTSTPTTVLVVLPTPTITTTITPTSTPTTVTNKLPTPTATLDNHPTPTPVVHAQTCAMGGVTWDDQILYASPTGFRDNQADGILQSNESRIAGVTVEIIDSTGQIIATAITDADGTYFFAEMACGSYLAHFYMKTDEYTGITFQDELAEYGSDPNQATGMTNVFTLVPGEYTHVDAGWVRQPTAENVAQEPGVGRLTVLLCRDVPGQICTTDATPAAGAKFSLTYINSQGFSTRVSAITGRDGWAVFNKVAPGQWQVAAGCLTVGATISLAEPSATISGNIAACAKTAIYLPLIQK